MATPSLTKHTLPGSLGDLLIDVRTGDRSSARPAVLIIHGFKGFKDWGMFPPLADQLARAGFTTVSFNLSGSGADDTGEFSLLERFAQATYRDDLEDIDRMLRAISEGDLAFPAPTSIGVVGHSRGGGAAVLMGDDPRIDVLVTWAGIGTIHRWSDDDMRLWKERGVLQILNARTGQVMPLNDDLRREIEGSSDGVLDIQRAAARVNVPWLIIHGAQDEAVPIDEARRLAEAQGVDSELIVIEGAGHTFGAAHPFAGITKELQEAMDQTIGWFSRHLR
jgi:pimeloyl-ACP methyl ester carboxylesterase